MSRPPTIVNHNPSESPPPEHPGVFAYAIIIHIKSETDSEDVVEISGVYASFKDAVSMLKKQRLTIEDGYVPPDNAASRDVHPFRNRIGELRKVDGSLIGWGYSWSRLHSDQVNRVWIQKTKVWRRRDEDFNVNELSEKEMQELETEDNLQKEPHKDYSGETAE